MDRIKEMFAALSQYEGRFQAMERAINNNSAILENVLKKIVEINHRIHQVQNELQFISASIPDSDNDQDEEKQLLQ